MKFCISLACTVVLAAGLVGCGGGGGDSSAAMAVTVSVNGSAATANASGQYAVKPGDTVEITPNQGANWTSSGSDAAAVTLRNPAVSGTKWAAQILNGTANPVTYTVSAAASANAAVMKQAVLNVAAGDTRNGKYRVYATSGEQQLLTLDFNVSTYLLTNTDGTGAVPGDFAADSSEPGTFVFQSSRITSAANTARFRMTTDTVVGSFPFVNKLAAGTYEVRPFIGARKLVTNQAELDGLYNRLGIERTAAASTSNILQQQITAGGTLLTACRNSTIFSVANCPAPSLSSYAITPSQTTAGIWQFVNVANAADTGSFAMARVGDQLVYLSAGEAPTAPGQFVWRLAMQDTSNSWLPGTARGGSVTGSWGTLNLSATDFTRTLIDPDGTTSSNAALFFSMTAGGGPAGMRQIQGVGGSNVYFGLNNTKLFAMVGASNATTGGYALLNLID